MTDHYPPPLVCSNLEYDYAGFYIIRAGLEVMQVGYQPAHRGHPLDPSHPAQSLMPKGVPGWSLEFHPVKGGNDDAESLQFVLARCLRPTNQPRHPGRPKPEYVALYKRLLHTYGNPEEVVATILNSFPKQEIAHNVNLTPPNVKFT